MSLHKSPPHTDFSDQNSPFDIAIDGPVAAGKGTVAKSVAEELGFLYVDTGAMYRMTALLALRKRLDFVDEEKLSEVVSNSEMDIRPPTESERDERLATVLLDGEDVSWEIREPEVGVKAALVAQLPEVRKVLVKKQQQIAKSKNVVMEGRDITTVVLPQASLKIYLTADTEVRVQRRYEQRQLSGSDMAIDQVRRELIERDERDMNRQADPLRIADDAWVLDTSHLSIEEVVAQIVGRVREMLD